MKYIDEFRDGNLAREIAAAIHREIQPGRRYNLMEFCGGHTHAISRHGIEDLLPASVRLIHGPGCPVCVLPVGRLQMAIDLALTDDVILCSYGDMLRVPAHKEDSLLKARSRGADVRMIYSVDDALALARRHPECQVVFFAIGFETTTPPTAVAILQAAREGLKNFSVFCNHVLTPAAMLSILESAVLQRGAVQLDGFVGPAHVSTVIGSRPYEFVASDYHRPVVIAGFEPLDMMQAILMLIRQLNAGRAEVENEFTRAVGRDGNLKAQRLTAEVLTQRDSFEWRGLGSVPFSALKIRDEFADFDAERRFAMEPRAIADHKACECADVLRGLKHPRDCKVFATACTPDNPLGSCMVSSEGACAAHYLYGRFREAHRKTAGAV